MTRLLPNEQPVVSPCLFDTLPKAARITSRCRFIRCQPNARFSSSWIMTSIQASSIASSPSTRGQRNCFLTGESNQTPSRHSFTVRFTRGPGDLKHTALFIGGKNVVRAEEIYTAVQRSFLGSFRCSVMLDPNGANTTAAAAVLTASQHLDLAHTKALVLGGTGPVGQRVAHLLARQNGAVWISSRSKDRQTSAMSLPTKYPTPKSLPRQNRIPKALPIIPNNSIWSSLPQPPGFGP